MRMSQSLPWSIEDLEPETRDAARRAARRAGLSVDEWLDLTMRDQETSTNRSQGRYHEAGDDMARDMARDTGRDMERELSYSGYSRADTASHRFSPSRLSPEEAEALLVKAATSEKRARDADSRTAEMLESITRWMEKTENRILAGERSTSERQERTASVMADAIKTVGSRLNDVERRSGDERRAYPELRSAPERRAAPRPQAPAQALSKANLADAVAEIRARQRDLEGHQPAPRRSAVSEMVREASGDPGIRALREELRSLGTGLAERGAQASAQASGQDDMRAELLRLRRDIAQGANRSSAEMASTLTALITRMDRQPKVSSGDQMGRTLSRLENDVAKLAAGRGTGGDAIERQIARLHQRLDQMGTGTDGAAISGLGRELADIKSRIGDDIGGRISGMAHELAALRKSQVGADEVAALRSALQQGREASSGQAHGEIAHVLRQIESLAARIDSRPGLNAGELDVRVAQLMQRLDGMQPAGNPAMSRQIEALAIKLDDMAGRAPDALERRLDEIQASLERSRPPVTATLERQIEALGARLENLAASNGLMQVIASDGKPGAADLRPIEKMLQQIQDRVEGFDRPDPSDALAAMSRQIALLGERPLPAPPAPDLSPIEAMLRTLQEQFEQARQPDAGQPVINALERQIALLATRIEGWSPPAADTQIEKTLRDLVDTVEAMRQDGRKDGGHDGRRDEGPTPEQVVRAAIENSLGDFKASHSGIESRIQTSFNAVHDTMERIAARLAGIETEALAQRPAFASAPAESRAASHAVAERDIPARDVLVEERAALADALMLESRMQAEASRAKGQPVSRKAVDTVIREAAGRAGNACLEPALVSAAPEPNPVRGTKTAEPALANASAMLAQSLVDQPLEPGSGRPGADSLPQASMVAGADPQAIKANYIAAARRAVQTAAAEAKAASGDERPLKGAKHASPSKVKALYEKRKKPILLGLAAAIIAMGSAQVISNAMFSAPVVPPEPKVSAAKPEKPRAEDKAPGAAQQASARSSREPVLPRADATPAAPRPALNQQATVTDPALPTPQRLDMPATPQPAASAIPAAPSLQPGAGIGPGAALAALPPQPAIPPAAVVAPVTGLPEIPSNIGTPGLRKAASGGDARAVFDLATRLADGRGMPRDTKLALGLFERAAAAGLVPAQFRIGNMYEKGIGTAKDAGLARLWYERAAEKGNAKAMHNLAVLYAEGVTGKPDYPVAAEWFRKAADHGVRDSQYNLAILLARGLGAAQDLSQSYQWFAVAATQGDEDAGKKRDEVALKLSPAELATARGNAEQWRARPADAQVNEVALPAKGWDEPLASPAPPKKPVRNSQG